MRIHLDTDLGSDTDDACALVGWPDIESRESRPERT